MNREILFKAKEKRLEKSSKRRMVGRRDNFAVR